MASDSGSFVPWPVSDGTEGTAFSGLVWPQHWLQAWLLSQTKRSPLQAWQTHSASLRVISSCRRKSVRCCQIRRWSLSDFFGFVEFPETPLRNQKQAGAAKTGLEQKHRMGASHRLAPLTSRLPLSFRIYQGKRRRAAGKSFPEVTVVTGKSQSGATVSYGHCN